MTTGTKEQALEFLMDMYLGIHGGQPVVLIWSPFGLLTGEPSGCEMFDSFDELKTQWELD